MLDRGFKVVKSENDQVSKAIAAIIAITAITNKLSLTPSLGINVLKLRFIH